VPLAPALFFFFFFICAQVVYLHGLLGSQSNFRGIASRPEVQLRTQSAQEGKRRAVFADLPSAQISTNRRVILPDLRNHGASPHSDDMTIEAMAADVVQLLDEARGAGGDKEGEALC
jgi:pimeloyl-ACP methyl ester carboxylesterase